MGRGEHSGRERLRGSSRQPKGRPAAAEGPRWGRLQQCPAAPPLRGAPVSTAPAPVAMAMPRPCQYDRKMTLLTSANLSSGLKGCSSSCVPCGRQGGRGRAEGRAAERLGARAAVLGLTLSQLLAPACSCCCLLLSPPACSQLLLPHQVEEQQAVEGDCVGDVVQDGQPQVAAMKRGSGGDEVTSRPCRQRWPAALPASLPPRAALEHGHARAPRQLPTETHELLGDQSPSV